MNAVFVELPAFERHRERYLDDAKDELSDLTSPQRDKLRTMIKAELEARRKS